MYSERLEALMSAALADGEITEKEKQILLKNAAAEGIDLDEFEMVLDARLVELKKKESMQNKGDQISGSRNKFSEIKEQESSQNKGGMISGFMNKLSEIKKPESMQNKGGFLSGFMDKISEIKNHDAQREKELLEIRLNAKKEEETRSASQESNKYGDVRKCPNCGAPVLALSTSCQECGYEFTGVAANSSVKKLTDTLKNIEREYYIEKPYKPKGWMSKTHSDRLNEYRDSIAIKEKQACAIKDFPIPMAKADLLEFAMFLAPKAKPLRRNEYDRFNEAYRQKLEEVLLKGKILLATDAGSLLTLKEIAEQCKIKIKIKVN